MPAQVADVRDGPDGTGVFARAPLHRLDGPSETRFATVMGQARLPAGDTIQLVGLHAQAPTGRAQTRNWRRDLRAQPPAPKSGPYRILAGDFNSTLDHAELRRLIGTGYRDAADDAGVGLHATYPSGRRFPPGIAIDHVLVDRRVRVRSARAIRIPGTNHSAVLAELVLPN